MIDQRDIEVYTDKVKAMLNVKSPTTVNEVLKLTDCIATLRRFMSRSANKCLYSMS